MDTYSKDNNEKNICSMNSVIFGREDTRARSFTKGLSIGGMSGSSRVNYYSK